MPVKARKLSLNRETVRLLDDTALGSVVGGCCTSTGGIPCSCNTRFNCTDPCPTGTCQPNPSVTCTV